MVIPNSVLDSLSATPVSEQLRDAGAELGFRLAQGEYDDLDEGQRSDLLGLAQMLDAWARLVAAMEAAALPRSAEWRDRPLNS
jgi:hypothetical protein